MNINESCLLNFLLNPDDINTMTDIFLENIKDLDAKFKSAQELTLQNT